MVSDVSKFTFLEDVGLLKKFRYVAEYNAHSANRELETLMRKQIEKFEERNSRITFE